MAYIRYLSLLLRDWSNKKRFTAEWGCQCNECGGQIEIGQAFFFVGVKEKICESCYNEVLNGLESED